MRDAQRAATSAGGATTATNSSAKDSTASHLPVSELNFCGEVLKILTCDGCGHEWTRTEAFSTLSLRLPAGGALAVTAGRGAPPPTLQSLLEGHFAPATLEVTCEKCGAIHAKLQQKVSRLPRVLPLHLMRFDFSGRSIVKRPDAITLSPKLSLFFAASKDTAPPHALTKPTKLQGALQLLT